jgi:hypothetical protein
MALAKGLSVYMNGVSLGCALTSLDATAETEALDSTTLCQNARTYAAGLKNGTVSASGIWNYDTTNKDEIDDVFKAAYDAGTENVLTATLAAIAVGVDTIMANGCQTNYTVEIANGQLIIVNAEFQATSGINYGKVLFNAAVNNTTTNGTSVDNSASSSNGGLFQAHIINPSQLGGSIKLQHSSDNSNWVDVTGGSITFSASSATAQAQYKEVTGTINRYVRAVGAATGGTVTFVAAFARR